VVATNCEQAYYRYLRPGEEVSVVAELTDVVGPKRTALGEGFFITQKFSWQVGDEDVAEMMWRIMKFKPADQDESRRPSVVPDDLDDNMMMRPSSSRDTKFFWDGVSAHELRIQKRPDGSLQHPPVPALWQDKEAPCDYVVACGKGTVFSFVVHHAPKVPGRTLPFVIALVELEEGVRCSASFATSTLPAWRSECSSAQHISTSPPTMWVRPGLCTSERTDCGSGHQTPPHRRCTATDVHRLDGDCHP
jgi:uncharacterized OB-fold protein